MNSEELLDLVLNAISERHGEDTEAYDMRGISILADYFVATRLLPQVKGGKK